MKPIAAEFDGHGDSRRVPKPQMEKRRRDRINRSLETLRLLLLENTCNEKLKNPKVEKAEILESVVDFLQAEGEVDNGSYSLKRKRYRDLKGELMPSCKRQQPYGEGMRSCLLRVGQFIATRNQELEDGDTGSLLETFESSMQQVDLPSCYQASVGDLIFSTHLPTCRPSPKKRYDVCRDPSLISPSGNNKDHDTSNLLLPEPITDTVDPVWRPW